MFIIGTKQIAIVTFIASVFQQEKLVVFLQFYMT